MKSGFLERLSKVKKSIFIGIIIILGLTLWIWSTTNNPQKKQDKLAIEHVYMKFEGFIRDGDFPSAYQLMSPSFKERRDLESFTYRFRFIQKGEESLEPQPFIALNGDKAFLFPKGPSQRHGATFEFEKLDGKWSLTGTIGVIQD